MRDSPSVSLPLLQHSITTSLAVEDSTSLMWYLWEVIFEDQQHSEATTYTLKDSFHVGVKECFKLLVLKDLSPSAMLQNVSGSDFLSPFSMFASTTSTKKKKKKWVVMSLVSLYTSSSLNQGSHPPLPSFLFLFLASYCHLVIYTYSKFFLSTSQYKHLKKKKKVDAT